MSKINRGMVKVKNSNSDQILIVYLRQRLSVLTDWVWSKRKKQT